MTTILPTRVFFTHRGEIIYKLEATEETLLSAGIISHGDIPGPTVRSCKSIREDGGVHKSSRLGNGNLRVTVCATKVIANDVAFKRFLGEILADTGLSLVKGEKA
jgi:hypothetical protein